MPNSRKTSYDLVLDPPVITHKIRFEILQVYSQQYNGLALMRLWHMTRLPRQIKINPLSFHFSTNLPGVGLWGPWDVCPSGERAIGWQGKSDSEEGITGDYF